MGRPKKTTTPPETELDLQLLQQKFLENRSDKKNFEEYFILLRTYARSITLKEIKRKNIFLQPERVDEICTDATILLLNQYRKEGWSIGASFAGALRWKVIEAMYKHANDEMVYSLNTTFNREEGGKEILDAMGSSENRNWNPIASTDKVDDPGNIVADTTNVAFEEIDAIVDEAYDILPYSTFIRFILWLVIFFRKPKSRNAQNLFKETFLKDREEDAFEVILLEIRDRLIQHSN